MNIAGALKKAKEELKNAGAASYELDSLVLICRALSFSKEKVIFNPEIILDEKQLEDFFALIARRKNGEPVSHLIGKREFYGNDFLVNKNVLDPRPDSESLIELVLEFAKKDDELQLLELGVGSGCLVISLLLLFKNSTAIGVDISNLALEVAAENALKNQVAPRLNLQKSDLFSSLNAGQKFDIIISNPPYIPTHQIADLQIEVRDFEPILALDGGVDGLDFYRKIAKEAAQFLKNNGLVFLEIGINQKAEIAEIFQKNDFELIAAKDDLSGIARALCFRKNNCEKTPS
jgi:release factor glutamine methyltransferase